MGKNVVANIKNVNDEESNDKKESKCISFPKIIHHRQCTECTHVELLDAFFFFFQFFFFAFQILVAPFGDFCALV